MFRALYVAVVHKNGDGFRAAVLVSFRTGKGTRVLYIQPNRTLSAFEKVKTAVPSIPIAVPCVPIGSREAQQAQQKHNENGGQ